MMLIITSATLAVIMTTIMMMACNILSKSSMQDREKMSPFECGFNPKSSARNPFSIQFFLLAMLFMIFDIEIAIILPIIITMKWSMTSKWVMTVTVFITLLIMGLYHEWKNGMLEWSK
uniref:NADH dehydrogenase subunit 3 n=1 Tax=Megacopta centronubila TaxID=2968963 RepID=UPI002237490F|nr:NADH dehydrogenase subunit 3 [Megacopta centronubila]UYA97700.1 NADH dehydrogenase subunit 3 [Megacopta centronubila]UYA97713.1 NADH dehydrogenase subunit 3 [Megacopta centronubila]